jgi:hypothetical protein
VRRQGWNLKRDLAEPAIVEAAEGVGAKCWRVSGKGCPDLIVRYKGAYFCGEVKTGKAKETKNQGEFPIWRTPDDVLQAIGAAE